VKGRGSTIGAAKAVLISFFEWFGALVIFCARLVRATFVPPYEWREFIRQMDAVGSQRVSPWSVHCGNAFDSDDCRVSDRQ
jgi:hypothetical protein